MLRKISERTLEIDEEIRPGKKVKENGKINGRKQQKELLLKNSFQV
jgi:hypothetical protein